MAQLDRDGMNESGLHHGVRGGVVLHTSTKHHGLSLWPPPSNDPHDPLCWPRWLKVLALCTTALCNFTANFSGAGPSVATQLFEMQFRKSASEVNNLLTVSWYLFSQDTYINTVFSSIFSSWALAIWYGFRFLWNLESAQYLYHPWPSYLQPNAGVLRHLPLIAYLQLVVSLVLRLPPAK